MHKGDFAQPYDFVEIPFPLHTRTLYGETRQRINQPSPAARVISPMLFFMASDEQRFVNLADLWRSWSLPLKLDLTHPRNIINGVYIDDVEGPGKPIDLQKVDAFAHNIRLEPSLTSQALQYFVDYNQICETATIQV